MNPCTRAGICQSRVPACPGCDWADHRHHGPCDAEHARAIEGPYTRPYGWRDALADLLWAAALMALAAGIGLLAGYLTGRMA